MDSQGKFLHVNRLGLELLGYSAKEMSTMYLFNLIPSENEAVVKEQYNMLMSAPKDNRLVTTLLTRYGKGLDVEIFCSVQYDTSHRNYIVSAFVRDVTERRDLEKKVSEYHERLENLLRENTLRLSETKKKMYHQKKFLDALIQKYEGVRSDDKFKGENSVCESCYREQIWIHAKRSFWKICGRCFHPQGQNGRFA